MSEAVAIPSRAQVKTLPKVKEFLEAKKRDSLQTASTYLTGLTWLAEYVCIHQPAYNLTTILEPVKKGELKDAHGDPMDTYDFLDHFVTYMSEEDLAPGAIQPYYYGSIAYLLKYGVDINPYIQRQRVSIPKIRREDQYPIDISEARMILSNLHGHRLRPFVFHQAAFGPRPIEICALRWKDVDTTVRPHRYYLRAEFSKNKLPREVYGTIESDKEFDIWQQRMAPEGCTPDPEDLVFASDEAKNPQSIYSQVQEQFGDLLDRLGMGERVKPDDPNSRRKITLYSFRRYVETTVEDNTSANFADYILGHKKSPYYAKKEPERRLVWEQKCHAKLIYLDYNAIEKQLESKEKENAALEARMENVERRLGMK